MKYDVVVVGGGHAGIEAAHAASLLPVSVLLITQHLDLIGQMSCNPSIGGIAKGTIVREIDAMGGVMGVLTDKTGIQFRMLNRTKGAAVWGNRAQVDKAQYRQLCKSLMESKKNLVLFQGSVHSLAVNNNRVCGVHTESGQFIEAIAVVITTGTFLNGKGHIGLDSFPCGRMGEPTSAFLSRSITMLGIKSGRLKTGTPARINKYSVDFSQLMPQEGDADPWPFSFRTKETVSNKAVCWQLKTNEKTHAIIRRNMDKSPLYSGTITGIGPRYCPSIEDKVIKFGDRGGHTLFLEPEGLCTNEMYLNGLSTSLPYAVQEEMVHSLPGLEQAVIMRPAYAIEYDFFPPTQLYPSLESRVVRNLYFAGQVNGTSGYEEAAGQGLIAGINAGRRVRNEMPFVPGRDTSYIGVLIDDLVTKGTEEPYRMFTSRAEYRLLLRQDNADERLMPKARAIGLIDDVVFQERSEVWEKRSEIKGLLRKKTIGPGMVTSKAGAVLIETPVRAVDLLKRPEISLLNSDLMEETRGIDAHTLVSIEADIKYEGFITKQQRTIEQFKKIEETKIPFDIEYDDVQGLLKESVEKMKKIKPLTLGQASRISGVTPADITNLIIHLFKYT